MLKVLFYLFALKSLLSLSEDKKKAAKKKAKARRVNRAVKLVKSIRPGRPGEKKKKAGLFTRIRRTVKTCSFLAVLAVGIGIFSKLYRLVSKLRSMLSKKEPV